MVGHSRIFKYDSRDNDAKVGERGGHEEKKDEEGGGVVDFDESSSSSAGAWASSGSFTLEISNNLQSGIHVKDCRGEDYLSNESSDATMQHDPVDPPGDCCWAEMQMRANMTAARQQLEYGLMTSSLGSMQLDAAHHHRELQASAILGPAMAANFANPFVAAQTQHHALQQRHHQQEAMAQQAAGSNMMVTSYPSRITPLDSLFGPANQHHYKHHPRIIALDAGGMATFGIDSIAVDQKAVVAARALSSSSSSSSTDLNVGATATTTAVVPTIAATLDSTTTVHAAYHPHFANVGALPSPQMTIAHYVPPTCATWGAGAQVPALSVQDRPLVPPIYNGINPNYPGVRLLHAHPPIFVVEDFLSHAECDFLIDAASDAFQPAPVVGKGSGEVSPSRTSSTCYLAREDLPEYLRKVGLLTGKPPEHCELPQVGRYLPGEQYLQHFDAFDLTNEDGRRFAANGGQRTVTLLVYLNDITQGGATAFPNLNIEVRPRRGMAVVFFPSTLDGLLDRMALHAALPAVDVKYVSQVWIRQSNYEGRPSKRLPGPMVAGLQEMRNALEQQRRAMELSQQQQFALTHTQLAQQMHHHIHAHNDHVQLQQLHQLGLYQRMDG
jgi:prolyl 4-hydroxylase